MTNEFEITARWKKSTVFAAHLYANGITTAEIGRLSAEDWTSLAKGLGLNRPSVQSIEVIREVLSTIETAVAQKIAEEKAKEQAV